MGRRVALPLIGVALPALVLAAIGVTHPTNLTMSTSAYWRDLHIVTLVIFPLLGAAPWIILRGGARAISVIAIVLGFLYAAFYTALDVLSGIGAGSEEHAMHGDATGTLFAMGSSLGDIGSWCLIAACVLVAAVAVLRWGPLTLPFGILAIVGSVIFLERHIYFPVGVLGQLCLAIGWGALVVLRERHVARRRPDLAAS